MLLKAYEKNVITKMVTIYSDLPKDIVDFIPEFFPLEWLYKKRRVNSSWFRLYLRRVHERFRDVSIYKRTIHNFDEELFTDLITASNQNMEYETWNDLVLFSKRRNLEYLSSFPNLHVYSNKGLLCKINIKDDPIIWISRDSSNKVINYVFNRGNFTCKRREYIFLQHILFNNENYMEFFAGYLPSLTNEEVDNFIWELCYHMRGDLSLESKATNILPYLPNITQVRESSNLIEDRFRGWLVDTENKGNKISISCIVFSTVFVLIISLRFLSKPICM